MLALRYASIFIAHVLEICGSVITNAQVPLGLSGAGLQEEVIG